MNKLDHALEKVVSGKKHTIRKFLTGVVVFATTYALILPAITIESDVAEDDPGIVLGTNNQTAGEDTAEETANIENEESVSESEKELEKIIEDTEYRIVVKAEANIFPEGYTLEAEVKNEENEAELFESINNKLSDKEIDREDVFEIKIKDQDGNNVQPDGKVEVSIESELKDYDRNPVVVFAEESDEQLGEYETEILDGITVEKNWPNENRQTLKFETDRTAFFAIAYESEEKQTQTDTVTDTYSNNDNETEEISQETAPVFITEPTADFVFFERTAGLDVNVQAPEEAFPEGTTMVVIPVNNDSIETAVADAVEGKVRKVQAVDISFIDREGNEVQPAVPIMVVITPSEAPKQAEDVSVVHVDSSGKAQAVEEIQTTEDAVVFEAESFSVYAVVYTVDFEYSVNGRIYNFSMDGGTTMSFKQLVLELGIAANDEEAESFINEVANVTFSDPSLVNVYRNSKFLLWGENDWVIQSLQPFMTEEALTVTMKDGQLFEIIVTDGQAYVAGAGSGRIEVGKEMVYQEGMNRLTSGKIQFAIMKDGEFVRSPYNPNQPYVLEMNIQGDGLHPRSVTFTGLEDGEYEVWEVHGDVNNDTISRSYDGMMLNNNTAEVEKIRVVYNSNGQQSDSGLYNNNARIENGSKVSMTFRNTYKKISGITNFEANKVWMDRKENVISAPEDASVVFTLYKEVGGVTSSTGKTIVLDGVADNDGEVNPWQAVFSELPTTENGQQIRYKVRETTGWPDYYACKNKGKNLIRDNEYLETSGGTIYNRHLLATIQIQKHFDIQPNKYSPEDWAEMLAKKQLSFELTNNDTHETWYFTLDESFTQSGQLFYLNVPDMQGGNYTLKEYRYKGLISERKWTANGSWTEVTRNINPGDNMDNPLFEMQVENHYVAGEDEPEGVYIRALKVWDDLDDLDEIRPVSVQVQLQATVNGQPYTISGIANPITLSEGNEWNTGSEWYNLPDEDENHNPIIYSVMELDVPEGYTSTVTISDNGTDKSYTITNRHRPEGNGKIKLKKIVEAPPGAEVPTVYYFTVMDSDGRYWTGHSTSGPDGHYTAIPVPAGTGEGEVEIEVPAGVYTIAEIHDGIEIPGYTLSVTGESQYVVRANQTEDAVITNHYEPEVIDHQITVMKQWQDQDGHSISGENRTVDVQLRRYHYEAGGGSVPQSNEITVDFVYPSDWYNGKYLINPIMEITGTVTTSGAVIQWHSYCPNFVNPGGGDWSFDNVHGLWSYTLNNLSGNPHIEIHCTESYPYLQGINASISPYGDSAPELELVKDTAFPSESEMPLATQTLSSSNNWSHTWTIGGTETDHAGYDFAAGNQFGEYYYYLVELDTDGNEIEIGEKTADGITLKEISYNPAKEFDAGISHGNIIVKNEVPSTEPIDIVIRKVDEENVDNESPDTLPGAAFRLEKYTSSDYQEKDTAWEEQEIQDTEGIGIFNFNGLTEGYYKIVETKMPTGYIKLTGDPVFSVVKNAEGNLKVVFEDADLVKYTPENGFRFGNPKGHALPATGGIGTNPFTICGGFLIGMAAILYVYRHYQKRKQIELLSSSEEGGIGM